MSEADGAVHKTIRLSLVRKFSAPRSNPNLGVSFLMLAHFTHPRAADVVCPLTPIGEIELSAVAPRRCLAADAELF